MTSIGGAQCLGTIQDLCFLLGLKSKQDLLNFFYIFSLTQSCHQRDEEWKTDLLRLVQKHKQYLA